MQIRAPQNAEHRISFNLFHSLSRSLSAPPSLFSLCFSPPPSILVFGFPVWSVRGICPHGGLVGEVRASSAAALCREAQKPLVLSVQQQVSQLQSVSYTCLLVCVCVCVAVPRCSPGFARIVQQCSSPRVNYQP